MKVAVFSVRELFAYLERSSWLKLASALGVPDSVLEDYVRQPRIMNSKLLITSTEPLHTPSRSRVPIGKENCPNLISMTVKFPFRDKTHFIHLHVECQGFKKFACRFIAKTGEV